MKLSAKQYAKALYDTLQETNPKDQDTVLDNFVKALALNNDLRLFEEISNEFHRLELEKKGIKQAEVRSAHPLTKDNERQIIEELNKIVNAKVELKTQVDEKLVGGVMIKVDDLLIDASVKKSLQELKENLSK